MADNPAVRELLKQLKSFREAVLSINKGGLIKSNQISPAIRAQAGKIYSEHGGLDILMDVLHVSADQIRTWARNLKSNPEYFSELNEKKGVGLILDPIGLPKKRSKSKKLNLLKNRESVINSLDLDIQKKCDMLRVRIEDHKDKHQGAVSYNLRKEVTDVIEEVGSTRPIAVLLGISDKILAGWRYYYSDKSQVHELSD